LEKGQLRAALLALSQQRFRPPGSQAARGFSVPTLERRYYAYKRRGLPRLVHTARGDKGRALALTPEQRQLLLDIRKEHPSASVPLMLRTLEADGRLETDAVSAATVRRLLREAKHTR
jgi:putative transposase